MEGRRREWRGGLSGNVAEEAFCLKSAPPLDIQYLAQAATVYIPRQGIWKAECNIAVIFFAKSCSI